MPEAHALVDLIRREIAPVEERLTGHPYLRALDEGAIPPEQLRAFAGEQYHIIESDLRSVALLVSRFGGTPARGYFMDTLAGEQAALDAIGVFATALGMSPLELHFHEPLPGAHAYTCYMAWLGLYGSEAEVAAAYLVNFPAWGDNCGRMSRALQQRYGLRAPDVLFFDQFAATPPNFERDSLAVIQHGLDRGVEPRAVHRAARLLQGYELLYWDTLYGAAMKDEG